MNRESKNTNSLCVMKRRDFLVAGLGFTTAALSTTDAQAQQPGGGASSILNATRILNSPRGRRKLGPLEVSAIGLGCMSMAGAFTTRDKTSRRWSGSYAPLLIVALHFSTRPKSTVHL